MGCGWWECERKVRGQGQWDGRVKFVYCGWTNSPGLQLLWVSHSNTHKKHSDLYLHPTKNQFYWKTPLRGSFLERCGLRRIYEPQGVRDQLTPVNHCATGGILRVMDFRLILGGLDGRMIYISALIHGCL